MATDHQVSIEGEFVAKAHNDADQLIFGWANVSVRKDGTTVVDADGENVPIDDLEAAAYMFVLKYRAANDTHTAQVKGELVESMVFTVEKLAALGLEPSALPLGWWVGFHLDDAADYAAVTNGARRMFSIEGTSRREDPASAAA